MKRVNVLLTGLISINLIWLVGSLSTLRAVRPAILPHGGQTIPVTPSDPYFSQQWHLQSTGLNITPNVATAWNLTQGSSQITIGIVDSGVDKDHPDLLAHLNLNLAKDFGDDDLDADDTVLDPVGGGGHGTHVAGIAAAVTDNYLGVAGVAWNAEIVPIKCWSDENLIPILEDLYNPIPILDLDRPENLVHGVNYANNVGCEIINMSWGYTQWIEAPIYPSLTEACYNAYMDDRLLLGAAGNAGVDNTHYPAALHSVMAVGSSDIDGNRYIRSNYGSWLDVLAPGVNIRSTTRDGNYGANNGTSMATPIVSGCAALLWSMNPYFLTNDDIQHIIELTALDIDPPGWDPETGWGVIDVDSAAKALAFSDMTVETHADGFTSVLFHDSHQHVIYNNDGPESGVYQGVQTYKITKQLTFAGAGYTAKPLVWVRDRFTSGWSNANPQYGYGFAFVPDGTLSPVGCEIATFAYYFPINLLGQSIDEWYPCNDPPCHDGPDISLEVVQLGDLALIPPSAPVVSLLEAPDCVNVEWNDLNTNEAGYQVERAVSNSGNWTTIAETEENVTEINDFVALGSESYDYKVRPFNDHQQSASYSPTTTIYNVANSPSNVVAIPLFTIGGGVSQRTRVMWTEPANQKPGTIDHYRIKVVYKDVYYCISCPPTTCCGYHDVTHWIDGDETTSMYFCADYLDHEMAITVYAVDNAGTLGRASQEVLLTSGSVSHAGCYTAPDPDPEEKLAAFDEAILPDEYELSQNFPNPFNPITTITVGMPFSTDFCLDIYNTLGQKVRNLHRGPLSQGYHTFEWDGCDDAGRSLGSGIYLYRMNAGAFSQSRKMLLLK